MELKKCCMAFVTVLSMMSKVEVKEAPIKLSGPRELFFVRENAPCLALDLEGVVTED